MEIVTKFAIGDKVWTIKDCKAKEYSVYAIHINKGGTIYYLDDGKTRSLESVAEEQCFASREELIKHISDDGDKNM